MAEVEMVGLSAVIGKLDQLQPRQTKAVIIKAVRAGNAVFANAVQQNAPVAPNSPSRKSTALAQGFLKVDIKSSVSATQPGEIVGTTVPGKYSRHVARWVEEGHRKVAGKHISAGGQVKGGKSYLNKKTGKLDGGSGMTTPNDFVARAFTQAASSASSAVEHSIIDSLKSKGVIS